MTRLRSLVLPSLFLAAFAINLDTTIVNVALPTLVRELHASTTQLEWIVDAYNLMFAALVLAAGNLSMGFGAALIFPSTLSLLTNAFTERRARARAIGLWGATTGVGIAGGPIAGGSPTA